ncbi:MAG: peptidoglycan-binding protein LysM [Bacteroidia bacterium]
MGLFDFIKNAGAKIFGNKEAEEAKKQLEAEKKEAHGRAVTERIAEDYVRSMGLDVQDLDITIEDMVAPGAMDAVETARIAGLAADQATREKVVLAVGNVNGVSRVSDEMVVNDPEPEAQFHTVVSGDTLGKIAKSFYGDPMKYPEIFEANKPMLKSPDLIYPGQVLRIPHLGE